MTQTPVRIRMLRDADGLLAGSEWDALRDGGNFASVDKTQGVGAARDWRCLLPSEYEVIDDDPVDYEPDGSPSPRPSAALRRRWPDADAADPPDKEDR